MKVVALEIRRPNLVEFVDSPHVHVVWSVEVSPLIYTHIPQHLRAGPGGDGMYMYYG